MKNIILTLLTLISFSLNAQQIDYDNFNTKLADSLLFVKINEFRDSLGLSQLIYSKVIYNNISKDVSQLQSDNMRCYHPYHPNGKTKLNSIKKQLKIELDSIMGKTTYGKFPLGYYEVCSKLVPVRISSWGYTTRLGKIKTYDDLIQKSIRAWVVYSPSHRKILVGEFSNKKIMLAAGSIVMGKLNLSTSYTGMYVSFQIVPLLD